MCLVPLVALVVRLLAVLRGVQCVGIPRLCPYVAKGSLKKFTERLLIDQCSSGFGNDFSFVMNCGIMGELKANNWGKPASVGNLTPF